MYGPCMVNPYLLWARELSKKAELGNQACFVEVAFSYLEGSGQLVEYVILYRLRNTASQTRVLKTHP